MTWWRSQPPLPDENARLAALAHQQTLAKPPGSLGRLEAIATAFAGWQGRINPELNNGHICVFAADHGVAEEGVSAYPAEITATMLENFAHGRAAINVLAGQHGASFEAVNMGLASSVSAPRYS